MERTIHIVGWIVLVLGVLMLAGGLICSLTVGTVAVQVLLFSSIFVNTIGITLLRWRRK